MGKISGDVWGGCAHPMQVYKSPHAALVICATLVNTHTHTDMHRDSF